MEGGGECGTLRVGYEKNTHKYRISAVAIKKLRFPMATTRNVFTLFTSFVLLIKT